MRELRVKLGLACLLLAAAGPAAAQTEPPSPWRIVREASLSIARSERVLAPGRFRTLTLDRTALMAILDRAPRESFGDAVPGAPQVLLPLWMPDGTLQHFRIEESPILEPELALQFPETRTFRGQGVEDPSALARFDWTAAGFHAMVLSTAGTVFVDPRDPSDRRYYVVYDKKDYRRKTPASFHCTTSGEAIRPEDLGAELRSALGLSQPQAPFGTTLRSYRLALAATVEYTSFFGGASNAFTAMVTTMNRVNGIYERELGIHMNLVANESAIIYAAEPDPYTNNDGAQMLGQNQTNLDTVIGTGSYDIGHVFSTGGGGIAGIGVVCRGSFKARGVTGSPQPLGDGFDVDYVAHEMGHQFGAHHTFNGTSSFCGSANQRTQATAFEPGSASTIMGYAGICAPQNLQTNSDDYFHAGSLDEIESYVSGTATCNTSSGSNNAPNVVAGPSHTIPAQTPFVLSVASASDPDGDPLTFTWEEMDTGSASPPDTDDGTRPIFRSWRPGDSARTLPRYTDLLQNTTIYGESLPTQGRTMNFRVTARDNHPGPGGTNSDTTQVTVAAGTGPFRVTAPNGPTTWAAGSTRLVSWDVAGTASGAIGCGSVNVLLSTDGGFSFPVSLASGTPNDGAEVVVAPNLFTTAARVLVSSVACGNIFFDISDANFTIAPLFSVADAAPVSEGNAGTVNASFVVTLSPAASITTTVSYTTASGSALSGVDFVPASGTLTFAPGQATATVNVAVKGDTTYETNETFFLRLTSAGHAGIADGEGMGTIVNDDPPPTVSIADALPTVEGNSGKRNMQFRVSLSAVSGVLATVSYATADGTATVADNDYLSTLGTLTFAPGTLSRTVSVPIVGDTRCEPHETLLVNLTGATQATLADTQGVGTIHDDDQAGLFQFGAPTFLVSEAAATALIKVTRDGTGAGATIDYFTSDGTAQAGSDYTATSGTLIFAANQTSLTFSVPVTKDTLDEPNETVLLQLKNPTGCLAGLGPQATAVLTITDNDLPGKLQLGAAGYTVNEAGSLTVTVRRLGGTSSGVTVVYATSPGTASDGTDYVGTNGTLTFDQGQATKTFQLQTLAVPGAQGNRTLQVGLSAPGGGAVLGTPSSAVVTIVDDAPSVQFAQAAYTATEAGTKAVISVKRTGPTSAPLTVDYSMADGSVSPATAGADYVSSSGTLSFPKGAVSQAFTVTLLPDTLVEGDETVDLHLQNVSAGAAIGTAPGAAATGAAVLTIKDNDAQQRLQFSATSYNVSESSPKAVITVKRTGGTAGTVTVDYQTADGAVSPATQGSDYTQASGTLTFAPGVASRTFSVPILPDTLDEGTETVDLTLQNPGGGALLGTPSTAVLNILDNEPTVQFSAAKYTGAETASKAVITVRRVGGAAGAASVDYTITPGTATAGADYNAASSGTLSFAPGMASRTFAISLVNDQEDEPVETVDLALLNPTGMALGTPSTAVLNITDNDLAGKAQFSAAAYSVSEGGGSVTITVTRTGGSAGPATVQYAIADGVGPQGAVAGVDYTAPATGTLTFDALETSQTFSIAVIDDGTAEPNKYLTLTLHSPGNGLALGTQTTAVLWIVDDD
jgi:hypothetical protein